MTVNREPVHITTLNVSDLSEGRDYEFRVMAENEVGIGQPSETAGPYKAQEPHGKFKQIKDSKNIISFHIPDI